MFKTTIFKRLIAIFLVILIFSFSVISIVMYYFIDNFVTQEKQKELINSGEAITSFITGNSELLNNPSILKILRDQIKIYSFNTDSYVWIVDTEGNIEMTTKELPELSIQPEILKHMKNNSPGSVQFSDERQYKKVMASSDVTIETGDFYGLFSETHEPWLVVANPYTIDGKVQGAVYFMAPMPKIREARMALYKLLIVSICVSAFLSIVLVYFFSLRISKPLKEINKVAKTIAGGEFKERVNIKSNDEIGELATSFNQMVIALENLEDMRRGFIANVTHELRTPMTSIRGFVEGILDGTIPADKQSYYLNIVKDEASRLSRLINDLLDLSKMEAGEIKLSFRDFDINELIRRCIINLENQITEKDFEIEADFQKEELYVNADSDGIERVVLNLLHNAVKFTPQGGKIKLSSYRSRGKIYVTVEDTGVGIDKDEINLIWERFYKSDKSRSKDKTGTGLGLAIIKNIINEHKQTIKVESEVGKGTKFTFTLTPSYKDQGDE
jgi:Signal transduction histidine kinase